MLYFLSRYLNCLKLRPSSSAAFFFTPFERRSASMMYSRSMPCTCCSRSKPPARVHSSAGWTAVAGANGLGQAVGQDGRRALEGDRALDGVLEFADVARE